MKTETIEFPMIKELREKIEALPRATSGKRLGIRPELKRAIVLAFHQTEMTAQSFAEQVGVSGSAFTKWCAQLRSLAQSQSKKTFRKLKIEEPGSSVKAQAGDFIVEGPKGLKITGINASQIAELWRHLC